MTKDGSIDLFKSLWEDKSRSKETSEELRKILPKELKVGLKCFISSPYGIATGNGSIIEVRDPLWDIRCSIPDGNRYTRGTTGVFWRNEICVPNLKSDRYYDSEWSRRIRVSQLVLDCGKVALELKKNNEKSPYWVSFENPKFTEHVYLPAYQMSKDEVMRSEGSAKGIREFTIRSGMHTDMIGVLERFLRKMPENKLDALYVEGRILSEELFEQLQEDKVFHYFWSGRVERMKKGNQEKVAAVFIPKKRGFTFLASDIQAYSNFFFDPNTLGNKYGFETGYYSARWLKEVALRDSQNALLPIFAGINRFRIGTDQMKQLQLRLLAVELREAFESSIPYNIATIPEEKLDLTGVDHFSAEEVFG